MVLAGVATYFIKSPVVFPVILLVAGLLTALNYKAHPREEKKKIDDTNQYPRVIRRLKYEYSDLYNKRSQLHNAMQKVEQTNTDANNKKRCDDHRTEYSPVRNANG